MASACSALRTRTLATVLKSTRICANADRVPAPEGITYTRVTSIHGNRDLSSIAVLQKAHNSREQEDVDILRFTADRESGELFPKSSTLAEARAIPADERASFQGKKMRKPSGRRDGQLVFERPSTGVGLEPKGSTLGQNKLTMQAPEEFLILNKRTEVNARRAQIRSEKKELGLVPTMGALHEGHLSLIRAAAEENDEIWVSIFVNPTQFGPNEDLATYPKTWDEDLRLLKQLNRKLTEDGKRGRITAVFAPSVREMYPGSATGIVMPESLSYVTVDPELTGILEGAARPNFFRGVTTVVMKLFNIVHPDRAYFGQKDIQQLVVINRMVRDFMLGVKIRAVPIEREESGLALSSRNAYLGSRRRQVATVLSRSLKVAEAALNAGKTSRKEIMDAALGVAAEELNRQRILPIEERVRFEVEYISLAGYHNLKEIEDVTDVRRAILSGTIIMLPLEKPQPGEKLGLLDDQKSVRLLDNIIWRNPNWRIKAPSVNESEDESMIRDETNLGAV